MSAAIGRTAYLKKNNVVVAGLQSLTISWGGESVDVTSGEDAGKRLLLAVSAQEQIDLSFEGITKDVTFMNIAFGSSSKMLTDITVELPLFGAGTTGAEIECNFKLASFEITGDFKDAIKFSASLESSDDWIFTPQA